MAVTLEKVNDIKIELKRFQKRLQDVEKKLKEDNYAKYGCKETGAVKRAALDLRNVLIELNK
jgi:hypothetical protein